MDLRYFSELATGPPFQLITWLQGRALLAHPLHCATCDQDMELKERNENHVDGFIW